VIYLSHNNIQSINKLSLMELLIDTRLGESLTVLRLNNNQLDSLPAEIGLLKNLSVCQLFVYFRKKERERESIARKSRKREVGGERSRQTGRQRERIVERKGE
jgi:hypothetical protein